MRYVTLIYDGLVLLVFGYATFLLRQHVILAILMTALLLVVLMAFVSEALRTRS